MYTIWVTCIFLFIVYCFLFQMECPFNLDRIMVKIGKASLSWSEISSILRLTKIGGEKSLNYVVSFDIKELGWIALADSNNFTCLYSNKRQQKWKHYCLDYTQNYHWSKKWKHGDKILNAFLGKSQQWSKMLYLIVVFRFIF